jgi:hypothetical protein
MVTTNTLANRPTAPFRLGRFFRSSDTAEVFMDNGASWDPVAIPGATLTSTAAGNKGLVIKGSASQTANLQEWQDSSGAVIASVSAVGRLDIVTAQTAARFGADTGTFSKVHVTVASGDTTQRGLVVKGAASQTANLQEWQNSAGTVLTRVDAAGVISIGTSGASYFFNSPTSPENLLTASQASHVPLVVRGAASQTGNLQEWQNSSGTVEAQIYSDGGFAVTYGAARPNNSLANGAALGAQSFFTAQTVLIVKGYAAQSANLQEWQNSAGSVIASITSSGYLTASNRLQVNNSVTVEIFGDKGGAVTPATSTDSITTYINGTRYRIPVYAY